ncbi:MAG: hypothetical protein IPK18_13195 [Sphingobacteriales bacterium]|nr:MAG: hypothetical protein IPK18_13195 [Sphingobacteriales bacterium]
MLVIIEVAISLIVVFFLLSSLVSFINELTAMFINRRGRLLYKSLEMLFGDNNILNNLYSSTQIKDLSTLPTLSGKFNKINPFSNNKPEYIGADDFSTALIEKLLGNITLSSNINNLQTTINNLPESPLKTKLTEILLLLNENGNANIQNFKIEVSNLFNNYMNSVTVIYKNSTKVFIFIISLIITISLNVDSIKLFKYFYNQPEARQVVISYAEKNIVNNDTASKFNFTITDSAKIAEFKEKKDILLNDIIGFDLPIGACVCKDKSVNIFGLFITVIALTLGAPFWYDLLMKLINARNNISGNKK